MTTITTRTSGPKAWKIALVAGAVGLATLVVANLPQTSSDTTGPQIAESATATLPESVTGFEYNSEATPGQVASPGVTAPYTGNSGELFPYENGSAPLPESVTGFEYNSEATPGQVASPGVTAPYAGNSGELFPYENGPAPLVVPDQATLDLIAPVITQEFLDGPASSAPLAGSDEALVNPVTEVDAAALIAEIIASERPVVPAQFAASDDALVRGVGEGSFDAAPYIAYAEGMSEAARIAEPDWEGLRGPYGDSTIGEYYIGTSGAVEPLEDVRVNGDPYLGGTSDDALVRGSTSVDPADIKFMGNSAEPVEPQRVPQQNVTMR